MSIDLLRVLAVVLPEYAGVGEGLGVSGLISATLRVVFQCTEVLALSVTLLWCRECEGQRKEEGNGCKEELHCEGSIICFGVRSVAIVELD